MPEFRINKFLSLILDGNQTIIYVKGVPFIHCKSLLITIPKDQVQNFDNINSIDEAEEKYELLDDDMGYRNAEISPETEFWGHCSNLQVWAENGYDTRFLHSNIAFALLKKLTEVGDPKARGRFYEEIKYRYAHGSKSVREYLRREAYLDCLPEDQRFHLLVNDDDFNAVYDLSEELRPHYGDHSLNAVKSVIKIEGQRITELSIRGTNLEEIPKSISKFNSLEFLDLSYNGFTEIPLNILEMENLKKLYFDNNNLRYIPSRITRMKLLEHLDLSFNKLRCLPKRIGKLKNLKKLSLSRNLIYRLPESFSKLKQLESLYLSFNKLITLPEWIGQLKNLKCLSLRGNKLRELPSSFANLKKLEHLDLKKNKFTESPELLSSLPNLKRTDI
ncbi:MAG: leucine-rich repeat domain-containing protein [Promethearchaeati archaeon]